MILKSCARSCVHKTLQDHDVCPDFLSEVARGKQTGVVSNRLPPGLSDLAARQFGVVKTRDQAADYGLTRSA